MITGRFFLFPFILGVLASESGRLFSPSIHAEVHGGSIDFDLDQQTLLRWEQQIANRNISTEIVESFSCLSVIDSQHRVVITCATQFLLSDDWITVWADGVALLAAQSPVVTIDMSSLAKNKRLQVAVILSAFEGDEEGGVVFYEDYLLPTYEARETKGVDDTSRRSTDNESSSSSKGESTTASVTDGDKNSERNGAASEPKILRPDDLLPELVEAGAYGLVWQVLVDTKLEAHFDALHNANCTHSVFGTPQMEEKCLKYLPVESRAAFVESVARLPPMNSASPISCPVPGNEKESYTVWPMWFSIYEENIVPSISREKKYDFSPTMPQWESRIPKFHHTFQTHEEKEYLDSYRSSYFCFTMHKWGWDCHRHQEILSQGCVPYFLDIEHAPRNTMAMIPRDIILEAMRLPGVHFNRETWTGSIDRSVFNKTRYFEIADRLLEYTRANLTSVALARYTLRVMGIDQNDIKHGILLSTQYSLPEYGRAAVLHGFRQLFGEKAVETVPSPPCYSDYTRNVTWHLPGKGFTYARRLDASLKIDRTDIPGRVRRREFDLVIIFAELLHRKQWRLPGPLISPLDKLILEYTPKNRLAVMDISDTHEIYSPNVERFAREVTFFRRELWDSCTLYPTPFYPDVWVRHGFRNNRHKAEAWLAPYQMKIISPQEYVDVECDRDHCTFFLTLQANISLLQSQLLPRMAMKKNWGDALAGKEIGQIPSNETSGRFESFIIAHNSGEEICHISFDDFAEAYIQKGSTEKKEDGVQSEDEIVSVTTPCGVMITNERQIRTNFFIFDSYGHEVVWWEFYIAFVAEEDLIL